MPFRFDQPERFWAISFKP